MANKILKFAKIVALLSIICAGTSCHKDDDENNKKNERPVFVDPNRPALGKVDKMNGTKADEFYQGYITNKSNTIMVDCRTAELFAKSHIKDAVNIDCESNDDAYWYNDAALYTELEKLDPSHSKYIQIYFTEGGGSQFGLTAAGHISAMGWGSRKVFVLLEKYDKFAEAHPDIIER